MQALPLMKIEPKETLAEVKDEEGLEVVNDPAEKMRLFLAVEEKENQRDRLEERERRKALDYYVDMAFNSEAKTSGSKRKRYSDNEEGDSRTKERKPRKPRKPRAPRKPRDRLDRD